MNVQSQPTVQVAKEDAPHIVALADDDSVFIAQLIEVGKGWPEHWMRRNKGVVTAFVILVQTRFNRCDVAHDALLGQKRHHRLKRRDGVFHRYSVDKQLRFKLFHLFQRSETRAIICKSHPARLLIVNGNLVFETQQVGKKASHLACAQY